MVSILKKHTWNISWIFFSINLCGGERGMNWYRWQTSNYDLKEDNEMGNRFHHLNKNKPLKCFLTAHYEWIQLVWEYIFDVNWFVKHFHFIYKFYSTTSDAFCFPNMHIQYVVVNVIPHKCYNNLQSLFIVWTIRSIFMERDRDLNWFLSIMFAAL